jgi:hypothetical protein
VGSAYSRPIPRRLVEEAGVPRDAFGAEKRGTSVWLAERDTFRVSPSREDYLEWLRERNTAWLKAGRLPPHIVRRLASPFQTLIGSMVRQIRRSEIRLARSRRIDRLQRLASREPVYPFMFPWALERAKARYLPSNAKRVG